MHSVTTKLPVFDPKATTLASIIIVMAYVTMFATCYILTKMTYDFIYLGIPDPIFYWLFLIVGIFFVFGMWKVARSTGALADKARSNRNNRAFR